MIWKDWKRLIDKKLKDNGFSDETEINYIDLYADVEISISTCGDEGIGLY